MRKHLNGGRRVLALLLALLMLTSLLPAALAVESEVGPTDPETEPIQSPEGAAVNAAEEDTLAAQEADEDETGIAPRALEGNSLSELFQGSGTEDAPYQIASEADLRTLASKVNGNYVGAYGANLSGVYFLQTQDITFGNDTTYAGVNWTSIGSTTGYYFGGNYDGGGHYIDFGAMNYTSGTYSCGLIGCMSGGSIKNVTIKGDFTTTGTSMTAAGGIVSYALYGAEIENCVNEMNITCKGSVGGIVGKAAADTVITSCINTGKITASAVYASAGTGGIVGSASGAATIEACINRGTITTSLTSSSSTALHLGGLVGFLGAEGTSVKNCGNEGDVIYETANSASNNSVSGGIAYCGSYAFTMEGCYNTGNIVGQCADVGGLIGYSTATSGTPSVTNCMNLGNVTNNRTSMSSYTGGIAAYSSGAVKFVNCYSAGTITHYYTSNATYVYWGAVTGYSSTTRKTSTYYDNCYYLEGSATSGTGKEYGVAYPITAADPTTAFSAFDSALVANLGSAYVADKNGVLGTPSLMPILAWMDPNATFGALFAITDAYTGKTLDNSGCTIKVCDGTGAEVADYESLSNGTYTYTVEKTDYEKASGSFTVNKGNAGVSVSLSPTAYSYTLTVTPADAAVTLTNSNADVGTVAAQSASGGAYTYDLYKCYGDYTWTLKCYGYSSQELTLAAGDVAEGSKTVNLAACDPVKVTFTVTDEATGDSITDAQITVISTDYDQTMTAAGYGEYSLVDGDYSYTVRRSGYGTVSGTFTVAGSGVNLSVPLGQPDPWDGSVDTGWYDPAAINYYISTPAELAGFAAITNGTADGITKSSFSGKTVYVVCDLDMNDREWTPIANVTSSSTPSASNSFCGTFDAQGHEIKNVKITGSTSSSFNRAFFSYLYGATVKNLVLDIDVSNVGCLYGGGVAAYANSSTFENITTYGAYAINATSAKYVYGGIVGRSATAVTITNCTNNINFSDPSGKSYQIGGIIGYCVKGTITDCVNNGNISAGYTLGGIAGVTYTTASTITRCVNTGTITSNAGSTSAYYGSGGIVGCARVNGDKISNCANFGTIDGATTSAGGILGNAYTATVTVEDCYNAGAVETTYASGYAGGIVGQAKASSTTGIAYKIANCYNRGSVSGKLASAQILGFGGTNYLTTDYLTNNYYLDDSGSGLPVGNGSAYSALCTAFITADDYADLITALGENYCADLTGSEAINGGYPILTWQNPYATFVVTFEVALDSSLNDDGTMTVTVKDGEGNVVSPVSEGGAVYQLMNGDYTYTVEKRGYTCSDSTDSGAFTVRLAGQTIPVNLKAEKYQWKFTVSPYDADFKLTDGDGNVLTPVSNETVGRNQVYIYELYNGVYTYTASKLGYVEDTGGDNSEITALAVQRDITVSYAGGSISINLVEDTGNLGGVTFAVTTYDGGDAAPTITISALDGDYAGQVLFTGSAVENLALPAGAYSYTVKATGYGTVSGEFTLSTEGLTLSVTLPERTGWDGESADTSWYTTAPSATEFDIYTEDELAGFAQLVNSGVTFSGKTVNLRADMNLEDNAWTPIGSSSTNSFKGIFNGNGCSVTINNGTFNAVGTSTTTYFGLFGYVVGTTTSRAQVKNLIMYGNVTANSAAYTYIGGVTGYATYTDFTNVSNRMSITVTVTPTSGSFLDLGGICGWSVYNNYSCCSNTGNISGTINAAGTAICYVGGLAGFTTQASSATNAYGIFNCYNAGNITATGGTTTYGGGLVGNGGTSAYQTMTNCYNSGIVSTGCPLIGNGSYSNGETRNNYYLDTTLGEGVTSTGGAVTEAQLSALAMVETLGGSYKAGAQYPVLYWEAAPYAIQVATRPDKTEYNDMEAFEDAGLSLRVLYSESDITGDVIYSGWQIVDGGCLGATQTGVTVSYMGVECQVPITVNQITHYIYSEDLALTIAPPVVGEAPQTAVTLTDERSGKITSATVAWYADGVEMGEGETFAADTYYRAVVTLEALYETGNVYYNFASTCKPDTEGYYELLYRTRSNSNRTFTFTLTYTLSENYSDSASHGYYAGDSRIAANYGQYLDDTLTITVSGESKTLTIAEVEKYALTDGGLEATYSYQGLNSRENYLLSGVPLYRLLLGQFPALTNASDESVVSIGGLSLTLGELRKSGNSYDESGALLESGLPYLLAFGVDGKPYTSAKGPLYLAAPAFTAGDENNSRFAANVKSATVDLVTAATFTTTFGAVDVNEEAVEGVVVTITDSYGNVVYRGGEGTITLNQGETYTYEVTAPGYGVKRGTISSAGQITVELLKTWSGEYKEPAYDAETNTYKIYTVEELMWYNYQATRVSNAQSRAMMAANIELMANLDLAGTESDWVPMGSLSASSTLYFYTVLEKFGSGFKYYGGGPYTGTFSGNGHTLSNLDLDWENFYVLEDSGGSPLAFIYRLDCIGGLFGMTDGAIITDVGVTGSIDVLDRPSSTMADWFHLGGLVGLSQNTVITGCYTDVSLKYTVDKEGEVIDGYTNAGYPEYCDLYIGGIAAGISGLGRDALIENCYATGDICGDGVRSIRAGGIAGATRSGVVNISKCYASGSIDIAPSYFAESGFLPTYVGGILGGINITDSSMPGYSTTVSYCFALNPSLTVSYADGEAPSYTHINRVIGNENFAVNSGTALYNFGLYGMNINGAAYSQTENEQSYRSASGRSVVNERAYLEQAYENVKWNEEEEPVWSFDGSSYPSLAWQGLVQAGESNTPEEPTPPGSGGSSSGSTTIINKIKIIWPDVDCDGGTSCPSAVFEDFIPTAWYHQYVDFVVVNGIFNGISKNQFVPEGYMTRAMFATVIARVETLLGKDTAGHDNPFTDVASGAWYEESVAWAARAGVINGVGDDKFAPNIEITREQIVTMLYRYAEHLGMNRTVVGTQSLFADSGAVNDYACEAVAWACSKGILTGKDENHIDPQGIATRAEVAAILYRFLGLVDMEGLQ